MFGLSISLGFCVLVGEKSVRRTRGRDMGRWVDEWLYRWIDR